jgi:ribosomal protein L16/L10AE
MLQPKRTKFRKQFKGRNRGLALNGNNAEELQRDKLKQHVVL